MSDFLLVLGVFVLAFACFSSRRPLVRKLGQLAILAGTFLAGWLVTGLLWVGIVAAVGWFLLPWLEILLRVRRTLIPMKRLLGYQHPPDRDLFPALPEVTEEIENLGFEKARDTGWTTGDHRQFFRLFHHPEKHQLAAVSLFEQGGMVLTFVSLSSRSRDGRTFVTWNYPLSYGLEFAPGVMHRQVPTAESFEELQSIHDEFLEFMLGPDPALLLPYDADELESLVESEMEQQLRHNLDIGLLQQVNDTECRYSWRGCFYLWRKCVGDMIRL